MKLPKYLLDQISYWEINTYTPWYAYTPKTKVTLHFRQWWKLPKTFSFDWNCTDINGDTYTYIRPGAVAALIDQLSELD